MFILAIAIITAVGVSYKNNNKTNIQNNMQDNNLDVKLDWKNFTPEMKAERLKQLSQESVNITQHEDTERPGSGAYDKLYDKGIYVDIVSGEPLFSSTDKYDSGSGWPSFVKPISENDVATKTDRSMGFARTEVRSKIADSHLGHVFDDGPADRGGKRYCMNSLSLKFIPLEKMAEMGYGDYIQFVK